MLEFIKSLYADCRAAVNLHRLLKFCNRVKHGDVISPTLFSIFIDTCKLVKGIKQLNLGVEIQPNFKLEILLFADDIVLKT